MNRISNRTFVASLNFYSIVANSLSTLCCWGCRAPLDIHQPNPNQPDQFLATCPGCGLWYRVESTNGDGRATVMQLPEVEETRSPSPAPGPSS